MSIRQHILLFFRMARPDQLLFVATVYSWGAVVAEPRLFAGGREVWLLALVPLLLIGASIHYANEYADRDTDALTVRTPFSGGSGALAAYGAPRVLALRAAWITVVAGMLAALVLSLFGFLPLPALAILAIGAAGGWMYSLPPLALAWRGWGEVVNALLGGVLLPAYGFAVQAGTPGGLFLLLALPFALHVFANLLATTWADRQADRQVGKYTLATRWPIGRLRRLYFTLVLAAYLLLFGWRQWLVPAPIVWVTLPLFPLALWAGWSYTRRHSPSPSVFVMVLFLLVQLVGWYSVGGAFS